MATDLLVVNSIFRDNQTYLSTTNWATYFKNTLKNGFLGYNPARIYHTQSGDVIRFNLQRALLQGQLIYHGNDISDIPVVTEEEGDQFIFYYWDGDKVTLAKTSMAGDNVESQTYLLANLLKYCYGSGYNISALPYTMDNFLPVCYGVYNNGNPIYWNLSKMLRPDGEPMTEHVEISGSGTIENIKYGAYSQYGLVQIYGGQNYSIKITDDYTQNQVILYPVPCINQQASAIYIVNETANPISVKIPTNYNRMTFDYVHSGDWITETDYISYSILPNVPVTINIAQIAQGPDYVGSGQNNTPISYYEVTQNIKNNDSGEGYTKAEANALFATKTEISEKVDATDLGDLAYKDTSELGDLAVKDTVDYEADIDNLPTLGTMAETDDAPSDGKLYGRQDADWSEIMTSSDIENALKTKANSSSVADEYDSSVEYTLGDVFIKDGQLYKDVEEWTDLNVKQIEQNTTFSVGDYGYYGDPLTLKFYRVLENFTPTAFVSDYVISQYVSNGVITEIQPSAYVLGGTYTVDQIVTYKVTGMYPGLYKLTSVYGKFKPVTAEDVFYTKEQTDEALSHKLDELSMDDVPESGSDNPVKSGGIYNALAEKTDTAVIAEDYDPEAEYAAGDLFMKDGQLSRYAYEKTQITTKVLTAQGHAVSNDYITYEDEIFHVVTDVLWNEQTVALAYDYVLANPQIFEPVEYELYDSQKEYEAETVVKIGGNYYKTLDVMAIETVNVGDVISEKLSIISFLNALDNVDAELDNVNELVASKANTSDMNSALALKADISYVESALDFITDPKIPTFYVNGDSGSDSTGDGTESAPFKTISKAINKTPNGGCANIVVLPYVYEEAVSVTGKKIRIYGAVNSTISIYAPEGISRGITVSNGGLVVLEGDFRITGNSTAVTVIDNSSIIYKKRNTQDEITLRATTTTATSNVLMIINGSSFVVFDNSDNVNVDYLNISAAENNLTNTAIWVTNGSFVSVPKVVVDINTVGHGSRGVYASGSIVTIHNMSGDYEVPVINDRSFVYIPGISHPVSSDQISLLAPKDSPAFTGTPTAPTPISGDDSTQIATTAFVQDALDNYYVPEPDLSALAPKDSPAFTGIPTAPTPISGDDSTQIATTAFVDRAMAGKAPIASPAFTGAPTTPTPALSMNNEQIANTQYVRAMIMDKADISNPTLLGVPKAPTAPAGTNNTQIATTAFVNAAIKASALSGNATIYVDCVAGNDTTGSGTQAAPYKTLQKAIDAVPYGIPATLVAVPGTYPAPEPYGFEISGKNITIIGTTNNQILLTGGPACSWTMTVSNGGTLTLKGSIEIRDDAQALRLLSGSKLYYESRASGDVLLISAYDASTSSTGIRLESGSTLSVAHGDMVKFNVKGNYNYSFDIRSYYSTCYFSKIYHTTLAGLPMLNSVYSTFICGEIQKSSGDTVNVSISNSLALLNGTIKYNYTGVI